MNPQTETGQKEIRSGEWLVLITVTAVGLIVLAHSVYEISRSIDSRLVYLLLLTVAGGFLSSKVSSGGKPEGSVTVGFGDFAVFAAVVLMGPAAAAAVGAVEGLISSLKVQVRRPSKILFNIAQLALAANLTGTFYRMLAGGSLGEIQVGNLILSALVYLLLTTLLVSIVMSAVSGHNLFEVWKKGFGWALPTHFANSCLVVILLSVWGRIDVGVLVVIIPLIFMAYFLRGASQNRKGYGLFGVEFLQDALSGKARGYLFSVTVIALPIYLYSVYQSVTLGQWSWLYLVGLALLTSFFPLRVFSIRDRMWLTLSDVLVFVALLSFGPAVAVVVASVDAVTLNLRKKNNRGYRWLFNLAQIVIVAFAVGQLVRLVQNGTDLIDSSHLALSTAVIAGCGLTYYLLSAGITSQAIGLSTQSSGYQIWKKNLRWCFPTVLGACLALVIALLLLS